MVRRLHVISASTRQVSAGRPLARWVTGLAATRPGVAAELIDLREVGLPLLDEPELPSGGRYVHASTRAWSATVDAADAFVLVMPMYNGGYTAPLKNAIDHLYREWRDKPVGLVSYSAGTSGGAPALEMVRPVLGRVGLRVVTPDMSVPGIEGHLGPGGRFLATPELTARVTAVLDAVTQRP
ncbi:NADPH-dependent FMN reductase [Streptomyces avicenniae]|uniref:NADPH-dependent FMN reductase n=1 Tax=Streptomyces avicenniae TaxID=500153 RepID=UPI00069BEDA1|nr:NAD(P)H-dependent oxidoreductase [Streptomyces avicenniae]